MNNKKRSRQEFDAQQRDGDEDVDKESFKSPNSSKRAKKDKK